jgi:hypothetical protein
MVTYKAKIKSTSNKDGEANILTPLPGVCGNESVNVGNT